MDRQDILSFARRDWALVASAKAAFWRERKRRCSAAEILATGDQLRQYARSVRADWPSPSDRAADLAVHERVAEALHAAGRRRR